MVYNFTQQEDPLDKLAEGRYEQKIKYRSSYEDERSGERVFDFSTDSDEKDPPEIYHEPVHKPVMVKDMPLFDIDKPEKKESSRMPEGKINRGPASLADIDSSPEKERYRTYRAPEDIKKSRQDLLEEESAQAHESSEREMPLPAEKPKKISPSSIDARSKTGVEIQPDNRYHDYKIKTYLNAEHYIYINGNKGTQHPHTFEFSVYVRFPGDKFIEFKELEDAFAGITAPYQNKCLNDIEPFNSIIPTTENMTEVFAGEIADKVKNMGGVVLQMTTSETPTRTYVVTYDSMKKLGDNAQTFVSDALDELIDTRLDALVKGMG